MDRALPQSVGYSLSVAALLVFRERYPKCSAVIVQPIQQIAGHVLHRSIAIIGAGQAGGELARSLRQGGFDGAVYLFGREALPPYERPPLSKRALKGDFETTRLFLASHESYARDGISLHLGSDVVSIDLESRTLRLADATVIAFDACVLATGAEARRLNVPGFGLEGVHVLRTIQDAVRLRSDLGPGVRLVIAGGGYLGLEVASSARALGVDVAVIETTDRLMQRSVSALTAAMVEERHLAEGTRLLLGTSLTRIEGEKRVERVITSKGEILNADAVLVAVGAHPAIELAQLSGLRCDNGILVDVNCQTSGGDVYAIGDCANRLDPILRHHRRLEAVNAALAQARWTAAHLLGKPPPPSKPSSFWSEQCNFTLQILGVPKPGEPCEDVLRGDRDAFAVYRFQDGMLVSVEALNRPRDFIRSHALIGRRDITLPSG